MGLLGSPITNNYRSNKSTALGTLGKRGRLLWRTLSGKKLERTCSRYPYPNPLRLNCVLLSGPLQHSEHGLVQIDAPADWEQRQIPSGVLPDKPQTSAGQTDSGEKSRYAWLRGDMQA